MINKFYSFLQQYNRFRSTPIVDNDFVGERNFTDNFANELLKEFEKLKNTKIVCLCGSTKFKDEFEAVTKEMTLQGNIVLSVGCFMHHDKIEIPLAIKEFLDELHKRKIDMCDFVYVINKDGYIGESTRSEINYARQVNKSIMYLHPQ